MLCKNILVIQIISNTLKNDKKFICEWYSFINAYVDNILVHISNFKSTY